MMQIPVVDTTGKEVSTIELPANIFEAKVNVGLMHQALVRQLANARQGTHKTKGRSEVARTTAKIYRQKGTGNARHGSRRAPIFVGGGVAHGPKPRDYTKKMPRQMRRAALRSALTVKASTGNLVVLNDLQMDAPKTKTMNSIVRTLVGNSSALLVIPGRDMPVERSASNLPDVKALHANYLNIRDLLGHDKLILTSAALDVVVDILTPDRDRVANEIVTDEE
jgi:large subunit ribosomal protein L4